MMQGLASRAGTETLGLIWSGLYGQLTVLNAMWWSINTADGIAMEL